MKIEEREIEINKVIEMINRKCTFYYSIYHHKPKVIVVPDYIEHFMKHYLEINTTIAFDYEDYSLFMGILLIGTKGITDIDQIEVF